MTQSIRFVFTIIITIASSWTGASSALARGGEVNMITLQQEEAQVGVKIAGNLSCIMAEQNTGGACELRIKESKSGTEYRLVDAGFAMQLFFSGKKNVSIEGRLDKANVIRVSRVIPL